MADIVPIHLTNSNFSRYALIDHDGSKSLRNDKSVVRPAQNNIWYVLATICGEQSNSTVYPDSELHSKNRRFWNGWMCSQMSTEERSELSTALDLPIDELMPLSKAEIEILMATFDERLGSTTKLPEPGQVSKFKECRFESQFSCDGFYFVGAEFSGCHFDSHAIFTNAFFQYYSKFCFVHFERDADFSGAMFQESANFGVSWFGANGVAVFEETVFAGNADFTRCHFAGFTDFERAEFSSTIDFEFAEFENYVPKFFHTNPSQDIRFSAINSNWPSPNASNGEEGKRAYTRLRQIMNDSHKPDEEYFFYRQEMKCKAAVERWPDRWIISSFGHLSDFGFSIARPIFALLFIWIFPAVLYQVSLSGIFLNKEALLSIPASFGLSFSYLFSFLGLTERFFPSVSQNLPSLLSMVSGIQTIMGFVLLFLLGLGLRNRFRIK